MINVTRIEGLLKKSLYNEMLIELGGESEQPPGGAAVSMALPNCQCGGSTLITEKR